MQTFWLVTKFWVTFILLLLGTATTDWAVSFPECVTNSQDATHLIQSFPCAVYGMIQTRQENDFGNFLNVTVQYMVHLPMGQPKAVVMLFPGGSGNAGIVTNGTGGVAQTSNNFLVRSAQLFAEDGYVTVTIDRPSDGPPNNPAYDRYRVSAKHALDIVTVMSEVNAHYETENLELYLAGTSRGSLSVVAQDPLGIGSLLSSPVTSPNSSGTTLWIGVDSPHLRLVPEFVGVPTHVLTHAQDGCAVTTPANAKKLNLALKAAGVESFFNQVDGGFVVDADPCQSTTFHGFLGIERSAIAKMTQRMDYSLKKKNHAYPKNRKPQANGGQFATTMDDPINVDLFPLASDLDGDALAFFLPHATSSRAGTLSINGSVVRYTPPPGATNIIDGFVYVVSDGRGGKSAAVVTMLVN